MSPSSHHRLSGGSAGTTSMMMFAYGSNMHPQRMKSRAPSAHAVTIGYIANRQLAFRKRSEDGSAKADAAFSTDADQCVWGVVYKLDPQDKPALDQYEFLGVGYDQENVEVILEQGALRAWMYVARRDAIDRALLPYSWYLDYLILGAVTHRLPTSYLQYLKGFQSHRDPDFDRHTRNCRIRHTSHQPAD